MKGESETRQPGARLAQHDQDDATDDGDAVGSRGLPHHGHSLEGSLNGHATKNQRGGGISGRRETHELIGRVLGQRHAEHYSPPPTLTGQRTQTD